MMKKCFNNDICVEASYKKNGNAQLIEATAVKSAWPRYHEDLPTLQNFQRCKNHVLKQNYPSKCRQTRMTKKDDVARLTKNVYESVEENLETI